MKLFFFFIFHENHAHFQPWYIWHLKSTRYIQLFMCLICRLLVQWKERQKRKDISTFPLVYNICICMYVLKGLTVCMCVCLFYILIYKRHWTKKKKSLDTECDINIIFSTCIYSHVFLRKLVHIYTRRNKNKLSHQAWLIL